MISFNQIGDDNRIPLVQIEFDNSMAVTGTPAQRQSVLLFGQAAMKDTRTGFRSTGHSCTYLPVHLRQESFGGVVP
ncbi:tail sheath protein [Escherichia coli]|nr:tail sheath protein [Escherichia coli]